VFGIKVGKKSDQVAISSLSLFSKTFSKSQHFSLSNKLILFSLPSLLSQLILYFLTTTLTSVNSLITKISFLRWFAGVASSLNYVDLSDNSPSPIIRPYPNWLAHSQPFETYTDAKTGKFDNHVNEDLIPH
jgi:hypothetical protein